MATDSILEALLIRASETVVIVEQVLDIKQQTEPVNATVALLSPTISRVLYCNSTGDIRQAVNCIPLKEELIENEKLLSLPQIQIGDIDSFGTDIGDSEFDIESSGIGNEGSGVDIEGSGADTEGSEVKTEGSGVGIEGSGVGIEGSGVGTEGSEVGTEGSGTENVNETFEITPEPEVLPSYDCGQAPISPEETKIVGGYYARPYSWPWQAELCMISPFNKDCYFRCGGSLIDSEWLMSAAHCVDGYTRYPEMFKMKLGTYDYRSNEEEGQLTVDIKEIHIHPSFGVPKMFSHDLSLLKIANGPINFTDHIQPVCILRNSSHLIQVGNSAYVTGWGATSEGGAISHKLRQVRVPFLDIEQCRIAYREEIDDTMACAGRVGIDSCQGDSGGPLVTRLENRRWYQIGIVSWGQGCAQEGFAGVYSRPSMMCDFIEKTVGKKLCR
uniref:limulus clotting factor C n=1 Tax=Syphacia muris TaxID=451379 RepID=A0A0N5AW76_9BILA